MLNLRRPRDIGLGFVLFSALATLCAITMVALYGLGIHFTGSEAGGYAFAATLPGMIIGLLLYQRFEERELYRKMEAKNRQS